MLVTSLAPSALGEMTSGDTDTSDELGHGTAVAGTVVAAGNNGLGVAGVAYDCTVLSGLARLRS